MTGDRTVVCAVVVVVVVLATVAGPVAAVTGQGAPDSAEGVTTGAIAGDGPVTVAPTASERAATGLAVIGSTTNDTATNGSTPIRITHDYRLTPARPGSITVAVRYDVPAGTDPAAVPTEFLAADETLVRASGFVDDGTGTYEWDGTTATPSMTVRYAANRTPDPSYGYDAVDAGPWAFVDTLHWASYYEDRSSHPVNVSYTADRPMTQSEGLLFLGNHTVLNRTAHGQRFRLVVPDAARDDLADRPAAILDALAAASGHLRVGERDPVVTVFVGPEPMHPGGAALDHTFWTSADRRLDDPGTTWLHEYAHTREDVRVAYGRPSLGWFTEGFATHSAVLSNLRAGRNTFGDYRDRWVMAARNGTLSDPSTWDGDPGYGKGAAVLASLDFRIRRATGGNRSLQDVVRRMNDRPGTVTLAEFERISEDVAGRPLDGSFGTYVETSAFPRPPDDPSVYPFLDTAPVSATVGPGNATAGTGTATGQVVAFRGDDPFTGHYLLGVDDVGWTLVEDSYANRSVAGTTRVETHVETGANYSLGYVQYGNGRLFPSDGVADMAALTTVRVRNGSGGVDAGRLRVPTGHSVGIQVLDSRGTAVGGADVGLIHHRNGTSVRISGLETDPNRTVRSPGSRPLRPELAGDVGFEVRPPADGPFRYQSIEPRLSVAAPTAVVVRLAAREHAIRLAGTAVETRSAEGRVAVTAVAATDAGAVQRTTVPVRVDGQEVATLALVTRDYATNETRTTLSLANGTHTVRVGDLPARTVRVGPRASGPGDVTGDGRPATDPDGDGVYEDLTGDGRVDLVDVSVLYARRDDPAVTDAPGAFDANGDGRFDLLDVAVLYAQVA